MGAYTTINYDECGDSNNLNYQSVEVHYGENKKIFNSGNFVKDWFDSIKFKIFELSSDDRFPSMYSSTIDHFIMDGAPYDSAYLVGDEQENYELCYGSGWHNMGVEFFVHEGIKPTWKELKELCK